jgi:hypothetical protein
MLRFPMHIDPHGKLVNQKECGIASGHWFNLLFLEIALTTGASLHSQCHHTTFCTGRQANRVATLLTGKDIWTLLK